MTEMGKNTRSGERKSLRNTTGIEGRKYFCRGGWDEEGFWVDKDDDATFALDRPAKPGSAEGGDRSILKSRPLEARNAKSGGV